jgi:acyl-ACP thioesterase
MKLTELVPPPPEGRTYTEQFRAGFADCAPSGRMRLDGLARWLQDIAYADVADAGLAQAAVWVVRRTRIQVTRFPRFGERRTLTTYCSGLGRAWAERRTTLDGVEAVSLWVHLDPTEWRPMAFSDEEFRAYGDAAAGRNVTARLRHPAPGGDVDRVPWSFRATELDIAAHINNAAYWLALEEDLCGRDDLERIDAEIEYRSPAQPGDKVVLRDGNLRWIVGQDGETHASILLNE